MFNVDIDKQNNLWMLDVYEELIQKYPFSISVKDNKLILENKRIKLVEIQDNKEDREFYSYLMKDYIAYLQNDRSVNINIDELKFDNDFNNECLHKRHNLFPMFFGFNNKNEYIGLFGFRKSLDIQTDNEFINLQEISIRTYSKKLSGLSISGSVAFFMLYAYAMSKQQHIFMSTLPFLRNTMFHVSDVCNYNYFTTKRRFVDVFNCYIELDIFATLKNNNHYKEILLNL